MLILASGSPRRAKILRDLGVEFTVVKSDAPEVSFPHDPERTVRENALAKGAAVSYPMRPRVEALANATQRGRCGYGILSADTIVWFNNRIYGKPKDLAEAKEYLRELSGNVHTVFTGVAYNGEVKVVRSDVKFRRLSDKMIDEYVARVKPTDRAGAYDIDESGDLIVESHTGSYENIMGLPVEPLREWKILGNNRITELRIVNGKTVILAAGEFPRCDGLAWNLLAAAKRVIACDSAADAYHRRFRKWPDVIIGDLDSFRAVEDVGPYRGVELIRVPDQDTNDLEKAMAYCARRGWKDPVIVGATGKREDHAIGNVFRALDYGREIVTDRGRFIPVRGKAVLKARKGAAVSVFAPDPKTRMTSRGLEWPLEGVKFRNLYCATLNRATATRVTLTANRPVSIYIEI